MDIEKQRAKAFHDCKIGAINSVNICFHPECNEHSINSHILQKNGILSSIAEDGHVMEMHINKYRDDEHFFKKIGINNAFSFNCFCNAHDTGLFKSIEVTEIDFSNYKNLLLFTLRTIYNEKFRKIVNVRMWECLLATHKKLFYEEFLNGSLNQEKLGLEDIERTEILIWKDLNENTESFVFKVRNIKRIEICMSSFYNYETSLEMNAYFKEHGRQKETVIDIFINLFPHKNESVFMMGYKKEDESQVKGYINEFFSDTEKRLKRKITNLLMFTCETWVISNSFYNKRIEGNDAFFGDAVKFSSQNMHERRFFDINIFQEDFTSKFKIFKKNLAKHLIVG